MRVFVTGASGWIGSVLTRQLTEAGHEVIGLARSEESAAKVAAAGGSVLRGSLEDLDVLQKGAAESDGVAHLGFVHDFSRFAESVAIDKAAIEVMGEVVAGSERPFFIASGVAGLGEGLDRLPTERDMPDASFPRTEAAAMTLALAERGVRSGVVRLPPSVHGDGDAGFIPTIIHVARERGVSAYVGDGANAWSSTHREDAARAFLLSLDKAPAGSVIHAVADEGVPTRTIAKVIGRHLDLPVTSVAPEAAMDHFGWIGLFFGRDASASSDLTRELLGWEPVQPGLVDDLQEGHYFDPAHTPHVVSIDAS
jgi:nucleoside-diphosphate-sugar epimerase